MNVALRAVHDGLRGPTQVATMWRLVTAGIEERSRSGDRVRTSDLEGVTSKLGVRGSSSEWMHNLRTLGVIGHDGTWQPERASAVATALELVADSFDTVGPKVAWSPVATLPVEVRSHLHPPVLRQTAGVLLELIDGSTEELLLATPFVDTAAVAALSDSLGAARRRGVEVAVVTSVGRGGVFSALALHGTETLEDVGGLRVSEVRTEVSPVGSHAKVLVVDRRRAYVGSANMTAAGLGRNIEIGVEVEGPQVGELARLLLALERVGTRVPTTDATRPLS